MILLAMLRATGRRQMELNNMDTKDLLELAQETGASKDTTVADLLGLQTEFPSMIYQINIGKYRLAITYGDQRPSAIKRHRGNIYTLNIQDEESHTQFHWEGEAARNLIDRQLTVFMPIIQKFMVEALTNSLKIEEQD